MSKEQYDFSFLEGIKPSPEKKKEEEYPRLLGVKNNKEIWENEAGETWLRNKGQGPGTRWDKVSHETQLNDMRSLTIWGAMGTSEEDAWEPSLISMARKIVGNSPDVTPEHIKQFKKYMQDTGNWAYMAEHPGKKAYEPTFKPVKEEKLLKKYDFSFLEEIEPLKVEVPEEEEKPSIFERIKGLGEKVLPLLKKTVRESPGFAQPHLLALAREAEKGKPEPPEMPTLRAATEREKYMAESGAARELAEVTGRPRYPEAEELEYGKFEQLLDIPGQFLTQFAKAFGWGLPEFIPGEEPLPKTPLAEVTGALGYLGGLAGAGLGQAAAKFAPFKVMGKVAQRLWKKPAKTLAGKVIQNVVKNANTLGFALGATEWEGGDAVEILKAKGEAFLSGEAIGAFFGGMQFVHFSKAHPMLSFVFRYGTGAALLDLAEKKQPFDERTLFNKVFDYGLTAYFLKSGVSAKTYQRSATSLLKEIKRFNQQAEAENFNVKLPESLEEITARVGRPETWLRPGEPERLMPTPTKIATEKGLIFEPEVPEAERIRAMYREAERPIEPETRVNIRPRPDGSVDITLPKPTAPPVEIPPVKEVPVKKPPITIPPTKEVEPERREKTRYLEQAFAKPLATQKEISKDVGDYIEELGIKRKKLRGEEKFLEAKELEPRIRRIEAEKRILDEEIRKQEEKKPAKPKKPTEIYRMAPEAKAIEKAIKERKEFTPEQKKFLKERELLKEEKLRKPAPLPEVEIEEAPERMSLVKLSITDPTGKKETFEIPEERVPNLQDYAKKTGVEIETGKSFKGRWGQLVPPAEEEKAIKNFIRSVKEEPKEKWEKWEEEIDGEYQKLYSGLAPPEFVKTVGQKILSKLQIEPQFKAVGGPDTGLAVKRYHPIRNAEVERAEVSIKKLTKLKYTPEEYQELTKIAAKPTKFYPMSKEDRAKFSPGYQIISGKKGFFKEYEARLKELDVIEEGWPKSQLNRLREEKVHIKAVLGKKVSKDRRVKLETRLKDIYNSIEFIKKSHPQYVHIPRMWFELIWDRNPRTAPRIITELFKKRETLDIEKLANYLTKTKVRDLIAKDEWDLYKAKDLDRPLLKPEDLDIRRIMFAYAHKVGHKIALAEIFRNAEKEGLLKDTDLAPQNWVQMPSRLYPTLKGKRAHPVLADFFETNFVRRGFMPPKLGGVLGTIKLMQFYNPLFLPMYDVVQAWWAGSVRSKETPRSIRKAFSSMKNKDSHYWDIHNWGGFSTPYTPSFETYMKRADSIIKENSFIKNLVKLKYINPYELYKLSWKTAWTGDHFIRMITYHHYLAKGLIPKEAAQTTARLHADYASIPPATRKWINKIFFTPSFKIAMMAAQAEMVKNAGRTLTKAGREKMTMQDKSMAKALIGLASGIAIREGIMRALGFKVDQFGLKYYKEIETEEGKKELVLHIATPDNVYLRFFHRFKNLIPIFGKEEQKLGKLVDRAKWEFHPLWQLSMEVYSNKSVAFEPIYNKFDNPEKIMTDVLGYSVKRLARITELIPGISESIKRRDAYNALVKDLDGFGLVLSGFTLPYIRNTRQKALVWEIKRLKRTFKWMKEDDPAKTAEEADRRLKKFRNQLEKLRERLKELREEE